jgi:hypothetical protein
MIALVSAHRGGWRLVSRRGQGADVLARAEGTPDHPSGRRALERLRDGDGTLQVVRTADTHFQWLLTAADGVVAQSPPIYRDPAVCRAAFDDAQRAARTALAGVTTPAQHRRLRDR